MLNFLTSLIFASLLIPSGFNFLVEKAVDYSYNSQRLEVNQAPQRIANKSFGLKTTAKSILVIDDNSGAILYQKDADAILPIASITKLMTALVILDTNPDWEKSVKIISEDKREGGIVYLLPNEEVKFGDLFYLMLTASTNEAAIALTRISGLEDFVSAMNKKAAELEMTDSYFIEPSGVEPGNVSTPADLVKLVNAAFAHPKITQAVTARFYEFETLNNKRAGKAFTTNYLLNSFLDTGDYKIIGAKTGYLDEAGYCLVIKVKKAENKILTVVLLGAQTIDDRWQEAKGLVDWVLRNYEWP